MLTFIPDIAEEHFEELQFLWSQRRNALRSAAYTMREMGMLEERIEAHAQGLLVLGDNLLEFVGKALDGDDAMPAFAAAYALLRLGTADAIAASARRVRRRRGQATAGHRRGARAWTSAAAHPAPPITLHLGAAARRRRRGRGPRVPSRAARRADQLVPLSPRRTSSR